MTDSAHADHQAPERRSRRALIGAGLGAALAVVSSRTAGATTEPDDSQPVDGEGPGSTVAIEPISADLEGGDGRLTALELELAGAIISAELAARDLYSAAVGAGATDEIYGLLSKQHEAYAQRIAGLTGIPADTRDDTIFDSLVGSFETDDPAQAGLEIENAASATYVTWLGAIEHSGLAAAAASISAMESRHAAALAIAAGHGDDLDVVLVNPATAGA